MKVRIKSGECPSYLTVGKVYDVEHDKYGRAYVRDNNGYALTLKGESWEIVDE